jgi:HEAT repeat protein
LHGVDHPDGARRRRAAAIAGFEGDETAALALFEDEDAAVRATALGALARMGRASDDVIRRAMSDAGAVRRRAAELAASLEGLDCRPLLDDADAGVVEAACFAAGELADARALPQLCRIATAHADALCRESAVAALGAIGDPAGLAVILGALGDKPAVRRRAVIALAPFDGPEVEAALQRSLSDRDWQVRQAAEDQLRP